MTVEPRIARRILGTALAAVALALLMGTEGARDRLLAPSGTGSPTPPSADVARATAVARRMFDRLPMVFDANRGQAPGDVAFTARGRAYVARLRRDGVGLTWAGDRALPASGCA